MISSENEISIIPAVNLTKQTLEVVRVYSVNRRDKVKRAELRENRLRRINGYRDEQATALKN